jgi:hypothetical protein
MKKFGIIILLAAIIGQSFSQEVAAEKTQTGKGYGNDTISDTRIILGEDRIVIKENDDALNIRIGKHGISILESLEGKGPKIEFEKYGDDDRGFDFYQDETDKEKERARARTRFRGHWSGVEFGFNNYLTGENSLSLPVSIDYMTLHSGKSSNFNLNFSQLSLGMTRRIGLVSGLGLNWNNYRFDYNNNIIKGTNGVIEILDPGAALEKSKFTTLYLTIPLLLEVQIPVDNNYLNLSAGGIGGIKLGSHTKMVFQDGDKVKSDADLSLNILRYGTTARLGYENFQLFATYYFTPLFKAGKSPDAVDLYPFEIGFAFTFND